MEEMEFSYEAVTPIRQIVDLLGVSNEEDLPNITF